MLDRLSSYEIAEWQAFEKAFGPLGNDYEKETLATIVDLLNVLIYTNGKIAYGDKNPVPEPKKYPRPHEAFLEKNEGEKSISRAEFDTLF